MMVQNDDSATKVGDFFPEADRQRITPVEYKGEKYEVSEQYWTHEDTKHPPTWQVSFHLGAQERQEDVNSTRELIESFAKQVEKVEVVRRLDYTFETMSDGDYVIFSKEADTSGMEVENDE